MKRIIAILLAVLTGVAVVPLISGADDAPQWTIGDAVNTAMEIKEVGKNIDDVSRRGVALQQEIDSHNAQHPGGCVYPKGHPEACAPWVREAKTLNGRMNDLRTEYNGYASRKQMLKSRLKLQFTILGCSQLPVDASPEEIKANCGNVQFDGQNPNLPPCNTPECIKARELFDK